MSKSYVDQAVQTEPPRHLSRSEDPKALNVHPSHSSQDAYSHPHHTKKPALGFFKPSEANLPAKRMVSLPESSPPYRLKPTGSGERFRASVSETTAVRICTSADTSISSECFETSVSLDSSRSSADVHNHRPHHRSSLASLAFPRTPSPPSSPESSIMIIGNNVQVSSSFLVPKSKSKIGTTDEEEDWEVWASSPPRPIPALHGPLSLPYARCPSGAEGTLVEGEDVSRMIWGLREDEPLPLPPRTEAADLTFNATKGSHDVPSAPPKVNQPIHHLRTPSSIASSSPAISLGRAREFSRPSTGLITPRDIDLHWYGSDNHDDSPIIIPPTPQQLQNFLELHGIFDESHINNAPPEAGLGLFWTGRKPGRLEYDIPPRLQASAPVFVPHSQVIGKNQDPPVVADTPSYADFPRRRTVSAVDLACLLQHQAQGSLLTPPSSTPTKWTPRFPDHIALLSGPNAYHATTGDEFGEDELPEPLPLHAENLSLYNCTSEGPRRDVPAEDPACMRLDRTTPSSSHSPALPDLRSSSANMAIPPSPQSPEVKLSTRTQPRSVPFARLLQRRLSAVPEEDSSVRLDSNSNVLSPRPPQTRRPGFQNGAQAPNKPYFAQATHNLPDISNKVQTSPSDASPNDNGRRSRVPSASASALGHTGSRPTSPALKQKVSSSKENTSIKTAENGNKGVVRKRGRNRAKKHDSAAVGDKTSK
ncbi:hypothetical protein AAF712_004133 [Marasmius tenuissimus]|uniref:Uncharacterized protein n=1 Tax=Marasmius tenuissimus TaxID=585030 RepID=A0ABR3A647_9AGAR|nr:hypothetical protein PM082_001677 [Marasmius tenuissimus]